MPTSNEIRQQFIDFFCKKHGHTSMSRHRPSCRTTIRRCLFANAGMNQFKPYFLGTEKPPTRTGRQHAEVHPRRRQAQRPRRRRQGHVPPHLFRDARQLELRRLLQEGGDRLGLGTADRGVEARPDPPARHRLRGRCRKRGFRATTRRPDSGKRSAFPTTTSISATRRTTSGRWATPAPADPAPKFTSTARRTKPAASSSTPAPTASSRSGTSSSSSSTATRTKA